ncbi:hypothetical protein EG68_03857 [Paragonimus skrjabini miyazakii]|uniref:Uncharacterized protein n=1 Tax=Paragonimus skrjabini miyazakii TaxID=59628 RepID=A0A8S9YVE4_9TREM|nr:hypothetical protein EG68_03857 [Paragonimus skrjabini miyazakii]
MCLISTYRLKEYIVVLPMSNVCTRNCIVLILTSVSLSAVWIPVTTDETTKYRWQNIPDEFAQSANDNQRSPGELDADADDNLEGSVTVLPRKRGRDAWG